MIDNRARDALKFDEMALRKELENAGAKFKGATRGCCCIFCSDKHPSAGYYRNKETGFWAYSCRKCQIHLDIIALRAKVSGKKDGEILKELNLTTARPSPPVKPKTVYPTIEALVASYKTAEGHYVYTHPETHAPEMVIIRYRLEDGKHFAQCRPVPGGFVCERPAEPLPLYNRARVRDAKDVLVVEGEKCVHALHDVGLVATTSSGGALNGKRTDWCPLAGKNVWLWPDNDAPEGKYAEGKGIAHMREVMDILQLLEPRPIIRWVDPKFLSLPVKGDVADFLDRLEGFDSAGKADIVRDLMADCPVLDGTAKLHGLIEDIIAGKLRAYGWPWPALGSLSNCLTPGTVTLLCGEGGSTKSLLVLEALAWWYSQGIKVAVYELEEDREYHLRRALAQTDGNANLTQNEWIMANPDEARAALDRHQKALDEFSRCIWDAPSKQLTLDDLREWISARAKEATQIIVVDPITAAEPTREQWVSDSKFVLAVKTIAREYNTRIVLVTHPKLGQKNQHGLDGLAGGAAYPRFCQTVLWLKSMDTPKSMMVKARMGDCSCMVDRVVEIRKARNGRGGRNIGLLFDYSSLRFAEQGLIVDDA
jgi:KaiC/GvpD/RAD55 family RecA-like ATPase